MNHETSEDAAAGDGPETGGSQPDANSPFSLEALQQLVEMMEKHGLSEISLQTGETKWKLRRGPEVVPGLPAVYAPASTPPTLAGSPSAEAAAPVTPAAPAPGGVFIKSPTVGTFYSSSSPDDPPFVTVGTRVQPDTVVCLVEAMKVFNQIPAEVSGVIAEVLVSNGDSVEFGQPLYRITPG